MPPAHSAFWRIWLVALVAIAAFAALALNARAAEAHIARHHHRHAHHARHFYHARLIASVVDRVAGFARARVVDVASVGGVATDVVREALRWVGHGNMTGTRGPWCQDFDTFVLRRTGHQTIASRLARDAVYAGRPISGPVPGAIMSMPHHTGFVVEVLSPGRVLVISGNHGHRVGLGVYSTRGARFALPA
ncbi:hypothetical protein, partial [Beijerinckia sp. L45]|uniref:hypothetical protein n=1 Tax=Beijerinckia sp. L45 TaxID=1641855 RepID=UPI00131A60FC